MLCATSTSVILILMWVVGVETYVLHYMLIVLCTRYILSSLCNATFEMLLSQIDRIPKILLIKKNNKITKTPFLEDLTLGSYCHLI